MTLVGDAREHQLRAWGARTLGLTYVPGTAVEWYGGATFDALDASGKTVSLRVDYRCQTVAINNGQDSHPVQIQRP